MVIWLFARFGRLVWSSLLRVCPRDNSIKLMKVMVFLLQSLTAGLTRLSSLPYKRNIAFPCMTLRNNHFSNRWCCTVTGTIFAGSGLVQTCKNAFWCLHNQWINTSFWASNCVGQNLTFQQLWHIVSAFGMCVSNPYVAKRFWEALQLEGDVGPEEWSKFFTRFIGHGRQVRLSVKQWDAHSHITRIICEYCKGIARVHGETHH